MQSEDQQQAVIREVYSLLSKRSDAVCNFLEGGRCAINAAALGDMASSMTALRSLILITASCPRVGPRSLSAFGKDTKLIYRHYATLYFVIAVDQAESELGILDLIQVFVEVLDKCFENVCELDLIFHSDKVHYILDEIVMGGMVLETNIGDIMEAVSQMQDLESKTSRALAKA